MWTLWLHYVNHLPWWPHASALGGVFGALVAFAMSASDVRDEIDHLDDFLDE
jgi:hypothetical protein